MRAILIDDEPINQQLLSNLLQKHCPQVEVLDVADSVDTAYQSIIRLTPDLIFLDVDMPEKDGFDLLRLFKEVDFSVIFVTGFDEYAIKAFEFNAVDYILKPIDYAKLIVAVRRAGERFEWSSKNLIYFVHSLEERSNYIKKITLHKQDKVHVIDVNDIAYISANKGYSEIFDVHQRHFVSAKPLVDFVELLQPFRNFLRINKSHLINSDHIESYTKGAECIVSIKGFDLEIEVSRRKKTEIISALKGSG